MIPSLQIKYLLSRVALYEGIPVQLYDELIFPDLKTLLSVPQAPCTY